MYLDVLVYSNLISYSYSNFQFIDSVIMEASMVVIVIKVVILRMVVLGIHLVMEVVIFLVVVVIHRMELAWILLVMVVAILRMVVVLILVLAFPQVMVVLWIKAKFINYLEVSIHLNFKDCNRSNVQIINSSIKEGSMVVILLLRAVVVNSVAVVVHCINENFIMYLGILAKSNFMNCSYSNFQFIVEFVMNESMVLIFQEIVASKHPILVVFINFMNY